MKTREMQNAPELIWQGRLHLGDEPGVFGDAHYSGLAAELPVTLHRFDPASVEPEDVSFVLDAERAGSFGAPYPGHLVSLSMFTQDAGSTPPTWTRQPIGNGRLVGSSVQVTAHNASGIKFASVRLEVDTVVSPGFYNDFVRLRLSLVSTTHYADLGFRD